MFIDKLFKSITTKMSYKDYKNRNKFIKDYKLQNYRDIINGEKWNYMRGYLKNNYVNFDSCIFCGGRTSQLHHVQYTRAFFKLIDRLCMDNLPLPRRLIRQLIPVCGVCHQQIHNLEHIEDLTIYRATKKHADNFKARRRLKTFVWKKRL